MKQLPHCPSCGAELARIVKGAVDYFVFDNSDDAYRLVHSGDEGNNVTSAIKFWCEYCHTELNDRAILGFFYENWDLMISLKHQTSEKK